ncbi:hypothetical protein RIF29_42126 [Crotalaria pallida]|uniref:Uncharacterized protein n=1 Tax=Crotalaria pallida TaxID=3830 RepID=A0AAN9HTC7_CROPI
MVFKGRFFSSSKKSDSDGSSNSPRSIASNSPTGSDKKKPKDKKTDAKPNPTQTPTQSSPSRSSSSPSVSPILASSLGLNKIKTRSGPLPQESFFSFRNDGSKLGASNLSKSDGRKKEAVEKQKTLSRLSPTTAFSDGIPIQVPCLREREARDLKGQVLRRLKRV